MSNKGPLLIGGAAAALALLWASRSKAAPRPIIDPQDRPLSRAQQEDRETLLAVLGAGAAAVQARDSARLRQLAAQLRARKWSAADFRAEALRVATDYTEAADAIDDAKDVEQYGGQEGAPPGQVYG